MFPAETGRRLAWVRAGLAAVIGLRIALGPYPQLGGQPKALFLPVSFMRLLPAMPPTAVIVAVQIIGVTAVLAVVAGRAPRASFAVSWAALLFLAGLRTSVGKILHNDVLLLVASMPFLLAPRVEERDGRSRACGWPFGAATAAIALAYFFSGFAKLRHSGIEWVTGDNLRYVLYASTLGSRARFESMALFVADRPWLAKTLAATLLGTELAFPIAFIWRRSRPAFVVLAVGLHLGTWFLLGLDYWAWIAVDVLVLVDWTAVQRGRSVNRATPSAKSAAKMTSWPRRSSMARPASRG